MLGEPREPNKGKRGELLPESNEEAPDSHRPQGLCPRCGKQSSFEILGSYPVTFDYGSYFQDAAGNIGHDEMDRVTALNCRNCRQGVVVVEEQWVGEAPRGKQKAGLRLAFNAILLPTPHD